MVIPVSDETWEDAETDAPPSNLERTEEELGFEEQSDGVWLKSYPLCSNLNTSLPAQSSAEN